MTRLSMMFHTYLKWLFVLNSGSYFKGEFRSVTRSPPTTRQQCEAGACPLLAQPCSSCSVPPPRAVYDQHTVLLSQYHRNNQAGKGL